MCRELEEFKCLHEKNVCKIKIHLKSLPRGINKKSTGKVGH